MCYFNKFLIFSFVYSAPFCARENWFDPVKFSITTDQSEAMILLYKSENNMEYMRGIRL